MINITMWQRDNNRYVFLNQLNVLHAVLTLTPTLKQDVQ